MEEKNLDSSRRSFVRSLVGATAGAGMAALVLGEKNMVPPAYAGVDGDVVLNAPNVGAATTSITGPPVPVFQATNVGGGQGLVGTTEGIPALAPAPVGVHGGAVTGIGVKGDTGAGTGVWGYATATSGLTVGTYGQSDSKSGIGVEGLAGAVVGSTYGVYGQSTSTNGTGVYGLASASSGPTYGTVGDSPSPDGIGIYGVSNGISVLGYANSASAKPLVARGASLQTANLQEWQNIGGTALSVVDKDGKIGIGTSSPSFMLHIISGVTGPLTAASAPGAGPAPNSFIVENLTSGNAKSQFTFRASGANKYSFGNDIAGTGGQNFFIWDEVAAEAVMYIDSGRRVGLGTLSPEQKLHVAGRVKATGYDTGDITFANGVTATEEGDGLAFVNSKGTKIAVLDSEGNFRVRGKVIEGL